MRDFWREETECTLKYRKGKVLELDQKIQKLKDNYVSICQEEFEFCLRNLENTKANELYHICILEKQLACKHNWKCLGGGGQYMSDVCTKCNASFDY